MKYLRVDIEGCNITCCQEPIYAPLGVNFGDLEEYAQDIANETHSYGYTVVDISEVPVGER